MKKLFLIKNPEFFQGKKCIHTNKNYFEGWYFKNSNGEEVISFIPGISINEISKTAFIQVITICGSYYVEYSIEEFSFSYEPFYIKIGNNYFSKDRIHIDINDNTNNHNLTLYGDIRYSDGVNIDTSILNPNIMGVFSYIPFMECNHAILNMKSNANGTICINNRTIYFNNGVGYIEKDWGCSFPKSYVWCQGNEFKNYSTSFMLSIANIPFKVFNFRGIICSLIIDGREYRFATYNNTKLIKYDFHNKFLNIILQKGKYLLSVRVKASEEFKLSAPNKGKMERCVYESVSAVIEIILKKNGEVIFSGSSRNCGLEIV